MGEFAKWLLHEDQKELFEYLYANALNVVFLALAALLLWPLGKVTLALGLAKGFWVFWSVIFLTASLLALLQRTLRVDMYTHFDAYVISGLVFGGIQQLGWSAFAALTVRGSAAGAPLWLAAVLYFLGLLSCFVAFSIVSAFYTGQLYRQFNLPLGAAGFILFGLWPAAGRALFGWFFDLAEWYFNPFWWFSHHF